MAGAHEVALKSSYGEAVEYEVPRGSQAGDTREAVVPSRREYSYTILPFKSNTTLPTVPNTGNPSPSTSGQRTQTGQNSKITLLKIRHSLLCWDVILSLLVLTALLLGLTALVLGAVIVSTHCKNCQEEEDSSNLQPLAEDIGVASLRKEVENLKNEVNGLLENSTTELDVRAVYDGCITETRQCAMNPRLTNVNNATTNRIAMCSTRTLSTARAVSNAIYM